MEIYCSARASANPASGVWHNAGSVGCSSDHAASCCVFCQASPNSDLDGEDALLANRSPTRSDRYERLPAWVFALWNLLSVARWPASGQSLLAGTGSPGWPHLTIPIWHGCGTRGHQQRFGTTKPLVNATSTRQGLSTDNAEVGGSIPPSPTKIPGRTPLFSRDGHSRVVLWSLLVLGVARPCHRIRLCAAASLPDGGKFPEAPTRRSSARQF